MEISFGKYEKAETGNDPVIIQEPEKPAVVEQKTEVEKLKNWTDSGAVIRLFCCLDKRGADAGMYLVDRDGAPGIIFLPYLQPRNAERLRLAAELVACYCEALPDLVDLARQGSLVLGKTPNERRTLCRDSI
jgi:hypothetical protein